MIQTSCNQIIVQMPNNYYCISTPNSQNEKSGTRFTCLCKRRVLVTMAVWGLYLHIHTTENHHRIRSTFSFNKMLMKIFLIQSFPKINWQWIISFTTVAQAFLGHRLLCLSAKSLRPSAQINTHRQSLVQFPWVHRASKAHMDSPPG